MSTKKLTIQLTEEQQKQIKNATGKSLTEINIDFAPTDTVNQSDLENVEGGNPGIKPW